MSYTLIPQKFGSHESLANIKVAFDDPWTHAEYVQQPPRVIPPSPPFEKWVPQSDTIALGEAPRDVSRYQSLQGAYPQPPFVPTPPKSLPSQIPSIWLISWALRDYSSNQDNFSILATPLLPPNNPNLAPQQYERVEWTLEQYNAFQPWLASFFGTTPQGGSPYVPAADLIAFGELPRDWTVFTLPTIPRVLPSAPPNTIPPIYTPVQQFWALPRDMTPEKLLIDGYRPTYLAIPSVPPATNWSFDYAATDYSFYNPPVNITPVKPGPQIPPVYPPYLEPPPWSPSQYQALQDVTSALRTPVRPTFPAGLRQQFTFEALLRDLPRATLLVQNFLLPPPPPRVIPTPPVYIEPPPWHWLNYQALQDQFSSLPQTFPVLPGFLVQAVTAGWYNGVYWWPGDVFMLNTALDYVAYNVDYSRGLAATPQFGWMKAVGPLTPIYSTEEAVGGSYPVVDPIPPKRTVY